MSSSHSSKRRVVSRHTTTIVGQARGNTAAASPARVVPTGQRAQPAKVVAVAAPPAPSVTSAIEMPDTSISATTAEWRAKARRTRTRFLSSLDSVQAPKQQKITSPKPRWLQYATWAVMLMPVYAILIYVFGFFYFLPATVKGTGVQTSFLVTPITTVGNVLVPDQGGEFLQTGTSSKQILSLIQEYPSRTLQPPPEAQMQVSASSLTTILIRQAQVSDPGTYLLYDIKDGSADKLVSVVATHVSVPRIALISLSMPDGKPWVPGHYMISVPESGLDANTLYCFFTITT